MESERRPLSAAESRLIDQHLGSRCISLARSGARGVRARDGGCARLSVVLMRRAAGAASHLSTTSIPSHSTIGGLAATAAMSSSAASETAPDVRVSCRQLQQQQRIAD